ncbi:hypothetical protein NPIL_594431, partial [Nephila pilipes]
MIGTTSWSVYMCIWSYMCEGCSADLPPHGSP